MELTNGLLPRFEKADNLLFGTKLESRRWWILLSFSLYNMSVALAWLTYGSIGGTSMKYFDINTDQLLIFSDSILYMYFVFSYIGCWLVHKLFRVSLLSCALFTAVGGWLRYFAGSNYSLALVGQFIIGVVYAPCFGFATLLPDRWFSMNERFVVTTIAVYSSYCGWALGYILPCLIVGDDVSKMELSLFVQALIMSIPIIIGVFCIKDKPDIPPSYSALVKITDRQSFWQELKSLLKTPKFVFNSIVFGLVLGVSYSISTVSAIFMEPLNLSYTEQGVIGFSYVVAGMLAGFFGTIWISKNGVNSYDKMIKILLSLSLGSLVVLGAVFLSIDQPNFVIILLCNIILGVGLIGFTPFICSSIIESTFPIQESMSTNAMFMATQILSVITSHLCTSSYVGKGGFLVLAVLILPCWAYGMFFYKTQYKKQEAEESHKVINQEMKDFVNYTNEDTSGLVL